MVRLQQSEVDKRGEPKGPYRSFFLMMGRMKASTTDNTETHKQVCAKSWPHSQQQQQQQVTVGIGVNVVGGVTVGVLTVVKHLAPQRQRLLKVVAIFKQCHPDRNTGFEL
jgi:hypothetical protein